jgi:hypothetical protein
LLGVGEWAGEFGHHVEEVRLLGHAHRLGLVDGGEARDSQAGGEHPAHAEQEVAGAVSEVGAEADVGRGLSLV